MKSAVWLFIILIAAAGRATAYDTPAGARYIGRGGINNADVDDVYALYYNPAQMTRLHSLQLSAELTSLFTGMGDIPLRKFAAIGGPIKRAGSFGVYWDNITLTDLYDENTFALCYGKGGVAGIRGFSAGVRVKYFSYAFHPGEEIYDDNGALLAERQDPLFRNGASLNVLSADAGLLYAFNEIFSVGASVNDIAEPNISFEGASGVVLPRKAGIGACAAFSSFQCNIDFSMKENDLTGAAGVQKSFRFPLTLFGSVKHTERKYSQKTIILTEPAIGFSYRIKMFHIAYAMNYPVNYLDTFGNHTLSLTISKEINNRSPGPDRKSLQPWQQIHPSPLR